MSNIASRTQGPSQNASLLLAVTYKGRELAEEVRKYGGEGREWFTRLCKWSKWEQCKFWGTHGVVEACKSLLYYPLGMWYTV